MNKVRGRGSINTLCCVHQGLQISGADSMRSAPTRFAYPHVETAPVRARGPMIPSADVRHHSLFLIRLVPVRNVHGHLPKLRSGTLSGADKARNKKARHYSSGQVSRQRAPRHTVLEIFLLREEALSEEVVTPSSIAPGPLCIFVSNNLPGTRLTVIFITLTTDTPSVGFLCFQFDTKLASKLPYSGHTSSRKLSSKLS